MFWRRKKKPAPPPLNDEETRLGVVLVRMRACTPDQIAYAEAHKGSRRLGETLVDLEMCSPDVVEQAMRYQKDMRNGRAARALLAIRRAQADQRKDQATQRMTLSQLKVPG